MRRKQPQQIINNSSFLDRDSGIVTETESDAEYNNRPNYIFSDDDDNTNVNQPMSLTTMSTAPLGSNSAFNSPSYYSSLADQSVISIRQLLKDDNWKKVLKHKSGTTVYMLQQTQKNEKIAFFRGESIIQGFTPQSIFYVIGMRKLWDEQ
jgi:dihydrofolate reductase